MRLDRSCLIPDLISSANLALHIRFAITFLLLYGALLKLTYAQYVRITSLYLSMLNISLYALYIYIAITPEASNSSRRGGGALRYRGGPHLRYVFRGRRGLFLRPPHQVRDFVKEGYFFVPRYEVWGSKSPYNPQNIRGSDAE